MIDFIIRDCGYGEFLPLIVETNTGRELYRGDRLKSYEAAASKAKNIWETNGTGNIKEFRDAAGLNPVTRPELRAKLIEWAELGGEFGAVEVHKFAAAGGNVAELVRAGRSFMDENGEPLADTPPKVVEFLSHLREALLG